MIDPTIVLLANATVEKRLAQELAKVYAAEKIVGPKGEPGKDGKDGLKGDKGDKGEKGDRGEMGPRGLPGKDGVDGKDGRDGRDGKDGVSKAGVQGPPGKDGRGIERLMIAPDGSVVVLFTDGETQNIGKAQINNVTNVNGGGGLLPDHYIINNVSVNGSILTITCNNNKRFEVTLPSGGGGSSVWGSITGTLSAQTDLQTALNGKANSTHTHAISDVTGLIAALAGKSDTTHTHTDATTSTSGFMSGADKTKLNGIAAGATVNSPDATLLLRANHTGTQPSSTISDFTTAAQTAAPAETTTTIGNLTNGATAKTTPVDTDLVPLADSASSFILRKVTWANIKATLKTYFDSLYAAVSHTHTKANITDFQHSITDTAAHTFPGGTTTFLRGDGTFAVPPGGGGGSPGGSTGQVQYNNAGAFAGASNVQVEGQELRLPAIATPANPASGGVKLYTKTKVGQMDWPAILLSSGREAKLQEDLGEFQTFRFQPASNSSLAVGDGSLPMTLTGTATAGVTQATNLFTMRPRIEARVTVAATTAVAGFRGTGNFLRVGRDTSAPGGFYFKQVWGCSTGVIATHRAMCGLSTNTAAPTDVEPSTLVDGIWMGWDAADTNVQIMHNDSTGVATKIDLGASFPVPTTGSDIVYQLELFSPNSLTQSVQYRVVRYNTNDNGIAAEATGTITTNLPSVTTLLSPRVWCSVGGTSSLVGAALFGTHVVLGY